MNLRRRSASPATVWGVNPRRDEVLGRPVRADRSPSCRVAVDAAGRGDPGRRRARGDRAGRRPRLRWRGRVQRRLRRGRRRAPSCSRELLAAAARYGLPVCGPNCNGIVSPRTRASRCGATRCAAPSRGRWRSSPRAATSPSTRSRRGAGCASTRSSRAATRRSCSAADYLEFLAGEPGVGAVALYLEDDGGPRSVRGAGRVRAGRRAGRRAEGRAVAAGGRERRPPTAPRWPATSGSSAASSRRRARSGPTTSTTCSSSPRRSPSSIRSRRAAPAGSRS